MSKTKAAYTLVETTAGLEKFAKDVEGVSWMAFDTEFIGEKRYYTLLCLIQVQCDTGNYLIDPIKIDDLSAFLRLIEDPTICKITHAGDNDYRLLHMLYGTVPKNIFDTQVAAGFIGYRYPMSFGKLLEAEIGLRLGKAFAVTDWEQRPMKDSQIKYALEDVLYLKELYDKMTDKLNATGRLSWVNEECDQMTDPDYYYRDPHHEALNSRLLQSSRTKERVFLLRLYEWRRSEAEAKNYSKEMILPSKIIGALTKSVRSGREALTDNRRLPGRTIKRHADLFLKLYAAEPTEEELETLKRVPHYKREDEDDDLLLEFLYLLMKYRCNEEEVSHQLVMPRSAIKKMKNDEKVRKQILGSGWRRELLGEQFIDWLRHFNKLRINIEGGDIKLKMME
ncbi:ribonuclease D [Lewinellaceae bacterium SD302]|nr:ribonuclease D [Lewinellaceae bacterium SD302]